MPCSLKNKRPTINKLMHLSVAVCFFGRSGGCEKLSVRKRVIVGTRTDFRIGQRGWLCQMRGSIEGWSSRLGSFSKWPANWEWFTNRKVFTFTVYTLIEFGTGYHSHPSTSSYSEPMTIFTFRAGFAFYQYPHFITLCPEGYTVINATVGMTTYGVEIMQGEYQGESEGS